ncbi:MAG: hypothetical protein AAGI10_11555 [Pseudomonadota bacterium]
MKHALFIAALAIPAPLAAEEAEEGLGLMERGMELFFEGLMDEMEPAIEGFESMAREFGPAMAQMLDEMGPAFAELLERVDDMANYEPPVMLPNGDIILRRKEDAPELPEMPEIGEDGAVDL